ncbi:hypothetical protein CPB85DRAFT_1220975 [Mucidula mucida]|nr:hypothetical protein CPB85DRAFT_1220975 [Mucidula mucida]
MCAAYDTKANLNDESLLDFDGHGSPFTGDSPVWNNRGRLLQRAGPARYREERYAQLHDDTVKRASSSSLVFTLDTNALRLVQFNPDEPALWITESAKLKAKRKGMSFFDITDTPDLGSAFTKERYSYPKQAKASNIVNKILPLLSKSRLEDTLTDFSAFPTRYYHSLSGKASSEWLLQKIQNYTAEFASDAQKEIIEVRPVVHPWPQTSIIIRFAPLGVLVSTPTTILGAHCDSLNYKNYTLEPVTIDVSKDDDGSGTVSILEAYRGLLVFGYIPASPLEFHFYSGEEVSDSELTWCLLGSQAIASAYELAGRSVRAMQEYDMTAWHKTNTTEAINIITSGVDPDLSDFQKVLIDEYVGLPWTESKYPGTASSDFASWAKAGYQSCHVTEASWLKMNHQWVHTSNDRIDISEEFSFDHMFNYVKLAVAFAVELSSY